MIFPCAQLVRRCATLVMLMAVSGWALGASASLEVGTTATALRQTDAPAVKTWDGEGLLASHAAVMNAASAPFTGSAWSDAWARAGTGFMQLSASGQTRLAGGGGVAEVSASSYARASISDSFLIACPSCTPGTSATLTFALRADSGLNLDTNLDLHTTHSSTHAHAYGAVQTGFVMDASPPNPSWLGQRVEDRTWTQVLLDPSQGYYHDWPFWQEFVTASFVFGDPLSYVWTAGVDGNTTVGAYSETTVLDASSIYDSNYAHTLYWGGIVEVLDSQGQRLEGITALNARGVDYAFALAPTALPVPEPASGILSMAGVVLLLLALRKREWGRSVPR